MRLWQRHNFWQVAGVGLFFTLLAFGPYLFMLVWAFEDRDRLLAMAAQGDFVAPLFFLILFVVLALVLFYFIFDSYRYQVVEGGLRVFTWRGPQTFQWQQMTSAVLTSYKNVFTLELKQGWFYVARVCLQDFRQPYELLEAIRPLLVVPIRAHEFQLAQLKALESSQKQTSI